MKKRLQEPLLFDPPFHSALLPPRVFPTSLVLQQTKPDASTPVRKLSVVQKAAHARLDKIARQYEHYTPPASATETQFRHGRWLTTRQRVLEAMRAANLPASRVDRFIKCGSDCILEMTLDGSRSRLRANYCGDRLCEPCMQARSRKVREQISRWAVGEKMRFVTLTLEKNEKSLTKRLNHLLESFVRLRDQKFWKDAVTAGVYFVEITRGAAGDFWHVHVHAIVCGEYINQDRLSDGWKVASRGSIITHIRAVTDDDRDIGYVSKYCTKGFDRTVVADADSLIECILSLRGRRMISPIGAWRGRDLDAPTPAPMEWKVVARLDVIVKAAMRREPWAIGALRSVRVEAKFDDETPHFQAIAYDDDG